MNFVSQLTTASLAGECDEVGCVATIDDFGEWKSEVASKKNPDGSVSFVTTVTEK